MSTPYPPEEDGARRGGCQCGRVRYRLAQAPRAVYLCHCAECRRQSGSAFGISAIVARAAFVLEQGRLASWERGTDSGGRMVCAFCPVCGVRISHARSGAPATLSVKGGTLDVAPDLAGAIHIWTDRALPGVAIPEGAERHPGEPPD